jgi:tetratricopeptide (TPR) repeat protein
MGRCLARVNPALAKREYRLAFMYGDQRALDEANGIFRAPGALLDVAPETPNGLSRAGQLLRDRPAEAAEAWKRAWESFHVPWALAELARARAATHEYDEALRLAHLLQETAPQNANGYVVAAVSYEGLGQGDDALRELELGAARLPGNVDVLAPLGYRYLRMHRFSQARIVFESIVASERPAAAHKRVLIARALQGQGRFGEALAELQVARGFLPQDESVLALYATVAQKAGRYEDALEALELASRLPSADGKAYEAETAELRRKIGDQRTQRALGRR